MRISTVIATVENVVIRAASTTGSGLAKMYREAGQVAYQKTIKRTARKIERLQQLMADTAKYMDANRPKNARKVKVPA
jgi:hypothetical protein